MSKGQDIRSFFTVLSKKPAINPSSKHISPPVPKTKKKRVILSDDDDIVEGTPEPVKRHKTVLQISSDSDTESNSKKNQQTKSTTTKSTNSRANVTPKILVLSSDSENESSNSKKTSFSKITSETKLKPANISDFFQNTPIKQSEVKPKAVPPIKLEEIRNNKSKPSKKENNTELGIHNDDCFDKTLSDLDDAILIQNSDLLNKTIDEAQQEYEKTTAKPVRKRSRDESSSDSKTPKKPKLEHTDSGIDPGQEAHEKKRYTAMLYEKYKNRGGPKNHGGKEYPEGKPDCLTNLCFLKTGVLDSLESLEFDDIVKQHGGRVVHGVSKKVNFIVAGDHAGPAKLAKAESYKIPIITEDEFLDIILTNSGMPPKYCKKDISFTSDDLGFETDSQGSHCKNKDNSLDKKDSQITSPKKQKQENTDGKNTKEEGFKKREAEMNENVILKKPKTEKTSSLSIYEKPDTSKAIKNIIDQKKTETENLKPSLLNANDNILKPLTDTALSYLSLADKYKPTTIKEIIGQHTDGSNVYKLKQWLQNWYKNQNPKNRKHIAKPSPWAKSDNGAYFKCVLLSGPPGIGKTTTATLVAKDLGLDIVEFNASDTRSKRLLQEEVSQLLSSNTIAGYAAGDLIVNKKRVLIMDEVDGMAGNEDRGGVQELIQLIKNTSIPIICLCNDRNHQKMRSLVNYCYDLKFPKPKLEQIKGAMLSICTKEGMSVPHLAMGEIVKGTGCDIRQTLNNLSIWMVSDKAINKEDAAKEAKVSRKDTIMGPWEVCRTVFTESEHKDMNLIEKAKLFFYDYSLGPLFVQENYLNVQPKGNQKLAMRRVAMAADSISQGDLIETKIRRTNNWSLLESQAFFSSVLPGHYMSGHFVSQINFPAWLGKNSKRTKFNRILGEIQAHTRSITSASKMALFDYILPLRNAIVLPLKNKGTDGINEAIDVMRNYNLVREDLDGLVELSQWKRGDNPMSAVETKVKTAFTRAYNKQVRLVKFVPKPNSKKKDAGDQNLLEEDEDQETDEDDISHNAMIKVKQVTDKSKKVTEAAGRSKKKAEPKQKGKAKKK